MIHSLVKWLYKLPRWSENLQLVVLGSTHHDPWIVLVEVKVRNAVCEASVHEESVISLVCVTNRILCTLTVQVDHLQPPHQSAHRQSY